MGMFNFVLDFFKRGIFDFKVKRQDLIAGTVPKKLLLCHKKLSHNQVWWVGSK